MPLDYEDTKRTTELDQLQFPPRFFFYARDPLGCLMAQLSVYGHLIYPPCREYPISLVNLGVFWINIGIRSCIAAPFDFDM